LECVTLEEVRSHQAAFQQIADANDGTRASGTPGYDASADYVAGLLSEAGYTVERQEFEFSFFQELSPAELEQLTPVAASYETGAFVYSGAGDVTAAVTPVDINLEGDRASTSGCEPEDFDGFPEGTIALIQRGTCPFADKSVNAEEAGAAAVIIFNQGNAGNEGLIIGTLAAPVVTIPVVGASFDDGVALAQDGSTARVFADTIAETRVTENVFAETPKGRDDNVVMAGAHLDSVTAGPGINDNGSGSAAILEIALKMRKVNPVNQVRFAWWGAEELGLVGSNHYVANLSEEERDDIALYLNFDMVGSPNFVRFVYDGNQSTFEAPVPVPEGSAEIEDLFERWFTSQALPYDDTEFSGRSDYQAFILNDIPAGGLFTGAEGIKTEEQTAIWGGTVGDQYDPCYHLACDTFDNNSDEALETNSGAIAFVTLTYAYSTESVNGEAGKPVPGKPFPLPEPAGPEGTAGGGGGGADPHDHHGER
ncbi:MAG: M28 family peptidase, partial [Nitriliruptorales bacterium]|nr:M28 family peptidase [Nitriliruptorales bacterium]